MLLGLSAGNQETDKTLNHERTASKQKMMTNFVGYYDLAFFDYSWTVNQRFSLQQNIRHLILLKSDIKWSNDFSRFIDKQFSLVNKRYVVRTSSPRVHLHSLLFCSVFQITTVKVEIPGFAYPQLQEALDVSLFSAFENHNIRKDFSLNKL